ncbi:PepSY domain-containing protein, partial [Oceanospirillum sp. HFRX-1_2]
YEQYSLLAKAMAWGIPLHMGRWGSANLIINLLLCLGIIGLSVAGLVMWWKRKPANRRFFLGAPASKYSAGGLIWIPLLCGLFVPLLGVTLMGGWLMTKMIRQPANRP